MKPQDKIAKASWTLLEGIKDQTTSNLITSIQTGAVKVEKDQLERLIQLVSASVEAGYHKGFRTFDKVVQKALEEQSEKTDSSASLGVKKNLASGVDCQDSLVKYHHD